LWVSCRGLCDGPITRPLVHSPRGVQPSVLCLSVTSKPQQCGGRGQSGCRSIGAGESQHNFRSSSTLYKPIYELFFY